MTNGKIAAMTIGAVGVVAIGAMVAVSVMNRNAMRQAEQDAMVSAAPVAVEPDTPKPAPAPRVKSAPAATRTIAPDVVPALPATSPELHERLKPVLNRGTRMADAASGFRDAEQFAATAHAARNTNVPFVVLKHRVLDERQTLAQAIKASRPDVDVTREALRAHDAARFDIAVITS